MAETEKLNQQIQIILQEIQRLKALASGLQSTQEIAAESYLAIDFFNNSAILEKNINQMYPIASVTKLMTAVIALENIDTSKTITLTKEMLEPWGYSPALFSGLNISAKNLLQASLIQSVNDASESLGYFLGKEKFLELMNKKAKELNMVNTLYFDTTGLNAANLSTASDLKKLLLYIYKSHPEILTITKNNDFWLPDKAGRLSKFKNINDFYSFPEFIGGKTGYLPEAKETFASLFDINKKPVAIILLFSPNRQSDIFKILDQLKAKNF